MRQKIYLNMNVYEALQKRFDFIFREFDNIYVSFSGGKDSGLLFNLLIQYMQKNKISRKIGLFHQDFEAQYQKTAEYVARTFDTAPDFIERFWCCLPMAVKNAMSTQEPYWYPWDTDKKELWVREMPCAPYVINLDNNPFAFYHLKMPQEEIYRQFNRWYGEHCGGGKTIGLIGVRADESLNRYSSIINKKRSYGDVKWTTQLYKNVWIGSPLYDWATEDIWTANAKFGFDYNCLYDLYYLAGCPLKQMRVASPFVDFAVSSLNLYRVIEADTWGKVVNRVCGANFGAIYGSSKAMGRKSISLPHGYTWETYCELLSSSLPAAGREKLKKTLQSMDNVDYKKVCESIIKNDYNNKSAVHFAREAEKTEDIRAKYRGLIRGVRK